MKKITLLIILSIFFFSCASDDDTSIIPDNLFIGDATLTTQAEVEAFGAENYTGIIDGFLYIGSDEDETDIIDISVLSTLNYLTNGISVRNTNLTSLNGLQNINRPVERSIIIQDNPLLENLDELSNITGSGIRIFVRNNANLNSISGLINITFSLGALQIINNPLLGSLEGLNNIELASPRIISNASLTSLAGLEKITEVGSIIISNNDSLLSLDGLENLEDTQIMLITENNALNDLSALSNIIEEVSVLQITENPVLTSLNGLENIPFIDAVGNEGGLFIEDNPDLTDLCGLQKAIRTSLDNPNFPVNAITIDNNGFNPTAQDFTDGNCSQ